MHDANDLEEHLRADTPCAKRDRVRVQGIDETMEKKLRERRKTSPGVSEEQKWKEIYMILFPKANKNALPSPCELKLTYRTHEETKRLTTLQTTTARTP
jgi:hypothetical protein